jgi:pyocin large subunit-like protein
MGARKSEKPAIPHNAARKKAMLGALAKTYGIVTAAAKTVGIDRTTHKRWMEDDPEYAAAVQAIEPETLIVDFAEHALLKRITAGDTTAIIFTLKTRGRNRGYNERHDVGLSAPDGGPVAFTTKNLNKLSDAQLDTLDSIMRSAIEKEAE